MATLASTCVVGLVASGEFIAGRDPVIPITKEKLLVYLYEKGVHGQAIPPGSAFADDLQALFRAKKGKWLPSFATYEPYIQIIGSNYSIEIQDYLVLVKVAIFKRIQRRIVSPMTNDEFHRVEHAVARVIYE